MEIVPIEQFVRENVSRFELAGKRGKRQFFNLYDKNGYCGEFGTYGSSIYLSSKYDINAPICALRIFNNDNGKLKQIMQKVSVRKIDYVEVKDHTLEIPLKAIPKTITTITTFLDFVNDKFKTLKRESMLKNELIRIGKDDPDFIYVEEHPRYEELKEKPVYEQKVEVIREGLITEAKREAYKRNYGEKPLGIPFIFW